MKKIYLQILFFIAIGIVTADWFIYRGFSGDIFERMNSLNLLAAYWGFIFFSFQYILSSRNPFIEKKIGLDKMLYYHTRLGIGVVSFIFLHLLFIIIPRLAESRGIPMFTSAYVGYAGLLVIVVLAITAKYYEELKIKFETWNRLHFLFYPLYFFLLYHIFFHADQGTPSYYLWIVFVAIVVYLTGYRIYQMIQIRKNPHHVTEVIRENENVTTLVIDGDHFDYLPGQFLYFQKEGFHRLLDKNPFTMSSAPHEPFLAITAKALGDLSEEFKNVELGRKVYLDGPYGIFSHLLHPNPNIVFLAGGIGITPFISMLKHMDEFGTDSKRVTLFWGIPSDKDFIMKDFLYDLEEKLEHFTLLPVMSEQPEWPGHQGFIDIDLIAEYVPDYTSALYMICGPVPMKEALEKALLKSGVPKKHIFYEFFDY